MVASWWLKAFPPSDESVNDGNREPSNDVTDKSRLLSFLPSQSSTDRPSASDPQAYGSADPFVVNSENDSSVSLASMEFLMPNASQSKSIVRVNTCNRAMKKVTRSCTRHPMACLSLLLATIGVAYLFHSTTTPLHIPGSHDDYDGVWAANRAPFSILDPVSDLGLYPFLRGSDTAPPDTCLRASPEHALPTNTWYQNLLLMKGEPSDIHRVYTIPNILDMVGPIPGLRIHPTHIDGTTNVVQLSVVAPHGLTIGAAPDAQTVDKDSDQSTMSYNVTTSTSLGVGLKWDAFPMTSFLIRGVPYGTMHFPRTFASDTTSELFLPTLASEVELQGNPLADGGNTIPCSSQNPQKSRVERELQLTFSGSDFTWLIFFSEPVWLQCVEQPEGFGSSNVILQVVGLVNELEPTNAKSNKRIAQEEADTLTIRAALLTNCTTGHNPIFCQQWSGLDEVTNNYGEVLRQNADFYPGPLSDFAYKIDNDNNQATITFDWDVRDVRTNHGDEVGDKSRHLRQASADDETADAPNLLMVALPHHMDLLPEESKKWGDTYCQPSLIGKSCLVSGPTWVIVETLPNVGFHAPRPPKLFALGLLASALKEDMATRLPDYYLQGAGDTYFSGKMLAKAGRILTIAEEVMDLCTDPTKLTYDEEVDSHVNDEYKDACNDVSFPTDEEFDDLLDSLRAAVEIWINGTAVTPFVYDSEWGGVVSCGCLFDGKTSTCSNTFPDCPSFSDPGLNFGNGFYNDHHFHYGYHIYAAAVVAHFDPAWGRKHFEEVLLLIRDIANPSMEDVHFPLYRHKDWYQGNSWASGVPLPPYLNGKNQESSSEAIASYEAVALFGQVMIPAWQSQKNHAKLAIANQVRDVGRLLTATEIRSADRYWHVRLEDESLRIYPESYKQNVVGMLWNTMAQFQTWFGNAPFLAYGIQLLPLTAIAESRDALPWLREMYAPFADSCNSDTVCTDQGWSILQLAVLASVGHIDLAIEKTMRLPREVFETAGGNGHSLSNSLWYLATRRQVDPIELPESDTTVKPKTNPVKPEPIVVDCGFPETCTDAILATDADGHTCRDRIVWLIDFMGRTQEEACFSVGGQEFAAQCGPCNSHPEGNYSIPKEDTSSCPACTKAQCLSELNRCPSYENIFVCTNGPSKGGCSPTPWELGNGPCGECCEMTVCEVMGDSLTKEVETDDAASDPFYCPPCSDEVCKGGVNLCLDHKSPFLCTDGANLGGCSPNPWDTHDGQCKECCKVTLLCGN